MITKDQLGRTKLKSLLKNLYTIGLKILSQHLIQIFFKKFFIHPSKDLLLQQINLRVKKMFKQGVKQEVKEFLKLRIRPDLGANKVIGIQEIKDHLKKKITLTEVKNLIQIRTRQYAKRQFTWARGKNEFLEDN